MFIDKTGLKILEIRKTEKKNRRRTPTPRPLSHCPSLPIPTENVQTANITTAATTTTTTIIIIIITIATTNAPQTWTEHRQLVC